MKNTRGGKREGAGRPENPNPRRYRSVYLTDAEYAEVKNFINNLKNKLYISK